MSAEDVIRREARLIIMRELNDQLNRSMTSTAMRNRLEEAFLIARTRGWVEAEFGYLAQVGAVRVTPAGSIKIATLTEVGRSHLALRTFLPDVDSPSEPVA